MAERIYFDNNANTPVLPPVLEAMLPGLRGEWGNASSIHQRGQAAKAALEEARAAVAEWIHARPTEIVFTSGGTESDNLALRGLAAPAANPGAGGVRLVTSRVEHHAVLHVAEALAQEGVKVDYLPVDVEGRVRVEDLRAALRPETKLVSVMTANNETGVLQPVAELAAVAKAARVRFHSDAIQALGKIELDAGALGCDLMSLSAHKVHGPAGVGALYVRRGVRLHPLLRGGRHERDRRAGSENVPGIAGFGAAARLGQAEPSSERLGRLRDRLESNILALIPGTKVMGGGAARVPNTSNIAFDGIEGEALVIALDLGGICVSTGAACSSGAIEPSHVLLAMGVSPARARGCLRFSLGTQNTETEVEAVLAALPPLVERLRRLSAHSGGSHGPARPGAGLAARPA